MCNTTRSIFQDFTLQNIRVKFSVEIHERIAQFHIPCLHKITSLYDSKVYEHPEIEPIREYKLICFDPSTVFKHKTYIFSFIKSYGPL